MAIWRSGELVLDDERHRVTEAGRTVLLTRSEFRILRLLFWVDGRVVWYEKLLELGCGWANGTAATNTVKMHTMNLRKKLGTCRRHLTTVTGVGLRYDGPLIKLEDRPHADTSTSSDILRVYARCG